MSLAEITLMSVPRIVNTIANNRPAFVWPSAAYRVSSLECRSSEVTKTGLLKNGCSLSVRATRWSSQFFSAFPISHSKPLQWARASGNAAMNVYYPYIHACQGRPSVLLMPNDVQRSPAGAHDTTRAGRVQHVVGPPLPGGNVFQSGTPTVTDGNPRFRDTSQERRVVFEPIVEPILVGFKADEHTRRSTMSSDHDLAVGRQAEVLRQAVFNAR